MLRAFQIDTIHLREKFPENADDEEWITWAAKENRIIISADLKRSKGTKALVLARNGAIAFFLSEGFSSLTLWPKAEKICHYMPEILELAETANPADIFEVRLKGGIEKRTWASTKRMAKR